MNIRKIIKEEIDWVNFHLDEVVRLSSTLMEGEPDMVWDFTKVKGSIDKSKQNVKTESDVKSYLNTLLGKIQNLPKRMRVNILKYVLASFTTILSVGQLGSTVNQISKDPIQIEVVNNKLVVDIPEVEQTKVREPSDTLYNFLRDEESLMLTAYDIGDGMITIGYGHAERVNKTDMVANKTTITKDKAEELLKHDVNVQTKYLNRILDQWEDKGIEPELTQGMYDSMISLMFNIGYGNFRMADFLQDIKKGDYESAGEKIKTTHITYPGHKPRREGEYKIFKS
jgi:GH24 family phage-related lysozyme (muramidase)